MHIIFEDHQYKASLVKEELRDICALQDADKMISVSYVGYFYNSTIKDCVFILPKVLLKDEKVTNGEGKTDKIEVVANVSPRGDKKYVTPEDVITPDGQEKFLPREYRKFIYEFAVWVYRSLCVYRHLNPKSKAIYYRQLPQEGRGRRHQANTYLDIILSMIRFNRENQNFFMFTIKNMHSGMNKINWTKTISRSTAIIQDDDAVYLDPINKTRRINFEEELLIIFFSILNFVNEKYGFRAPINWQYDLITGKQFKNYLNGRGMIRLKQIKYKYFSDKALHLWDMCYAFFDAAYKINISTNQKEYILAKSFEYVFEAMIDELIGDKDIPKGLKEQDDGKRVDHMYTYKSLTSSDNQDEDIYYIGDSKYYKSGNRLGRESIYKQYTYARNVIQWNIDLFMNDQHKDWSDEERAELREDQNRFSKIRLRNDEKDPLTEGYNVIPNFFLSAYVNKEHKYVAPENIAPHEKNPTHFSSQFNDRLFDRDSLILSHYDVNFLYVLYLYARNKSGEKRAWRDEVRKIFRDEIRKVVSQKFDFYAMRSINKPEQGERIIKENFKELQGKLFRPYEDSDIYSLALETHEGQDTKDSAAYQLLSKYFIITEKLSLGTDPKDELNTKAKEYEESQRYTPLPHELLPSYHIERYKDDYFVVGMYHDKQHWDWMMGENDKHTLIYNVRLSKDRDGFTAKTRIKKMNPRFVILYQKGHEKDNMIHIFKVHHFVDTMTQERMAATYYPTNRGGAKGDYFLFVFDEEVTFENLDIYSLLKDNSEDHVKGEPIYVKGEDLMRYEI